MHDPITEESLLLYMRRGNYHLIFVKSYFYNLCTIPRHFRCYSQNVPKSKRPIVKTSLNSSKRPKKWSKRPHGKNVGQNVPKMIFFHIYIYLHIWCTGCPSILGEFKKKRKGFGQMYFKHSFPSNLASVAVPSHTWSPLA